MNTQFEKVSTLSFYALMLAFSCAMLLAPFKATASLTEDYQVRMTNFNF